MTQSGEVISEETIASGKTFGPYQLLGRLGRGSMTEVVEAKRVGVEGFEKRLVIKRLWPDAMKSESLVSAWTERAKEALRLSHANIAHVFDVGQVDDGGGLRAYLASERVLGTSLSTLLENARRRERSLAVPLCLYIAAEAAKALEHAHRRRGADLSPLCVTHGDLTLRNVMITREGEVKLTDFRVGQACYDAYPNWREEAVPFARKLPYLSPEQVAGAAPSELSDQFSLGVVLFELLTGKSPFVGDGALEILANIQEARIPELASLRGDASDGVARLVNRMLSLEPAQRYESAGSLYECLSEELFSHGRFGPGDLREWMLDLEEQPAVESADAALEASFAHEPTPTSVRPKGTQEGDSGEPRAASVPSALIEAPVVGRNPELKALGWALDQAAAGSPQVLGLIGEAGAGKTRLVAEMVLRIRREEVPVAVHVASCDVSMNQVPTAALAVMLGALSGVPFGRDFRLIAAVRRLRELGVSAAERRTVLAQLGPERSPVRRAHFHRALSSILEGLSRELPTALVWDDADAMDPLSADLLSGALALNPGGKVLVLFAARPAEGSGFSKIPGYREVALGPLEDASVTRMVAEQLGGVSVGKRLQDAVIHGASGNPLLTQELLREALEGGSMEAEEGGGIELTSESDLLASTTVLDCFQARIGKLSEVETKVLSAAAVLGEPLDVSLLESLVDAPGDVTSVTDALVSMGLMRKLTPSGLRLASRAVRDAIVAHLPSDETKRLYRQTAAVRLRSGVGTPLELRAIVAQLVKGGASADAAKHLEELGLTELSEGLYERAVSDLTRALELGVECRTLGELTSNLSLLARAVRQAGSVDGLGSLPARLSSRYEAEDDLDAEKRVRGLMDMSACYRALHDYEKAFDLLERAAQTPGCSELASVELHLARAELANETGDFKTAIRSLAQGRASGRTERFLLAQAHTLAGLGESARAFQTLSRIKSSQAPQVVCERSRLLALASAARGDWTGVLDAASHAENLARNAGLLGPWALSLQMVSDAYVRSGDFARGYGAAQRSQQAAQALGSEKRIFEAEYRLQFLDAHRDGSPGSVMERFVSRAIAAGWMQDALVIGYLRGLLDRKQAPERAKALLEETRERSKLRGNVILARVAEQALKAL